MIMKLYLWYIYTYIYYYYYTHYYRYEAKYEVRISPNIMEGGYIRVKVMDF